MWCSISDYAAVPNIHVGKSKDLLTIILYVCDPLAVLRRLTFFLQANIARIFTSLLVSFRTPLGYTIVDLQMKRSEIVSIYVCRRNWTH